jgi:hypothetical protein
MNRPIQRERGGLCSRAGEEKREAAREKEMVGT